MLPTRTFRNRIRIGFAVVVILAIASDFVSFLLLRSVIQAKDAVVSDYAQELLKVRELEIASEKLVSSSRAYLLTGDAQFLERASLARRQFADAERSLMSTSRSTDDTDLLAKVARDNAAYQAAVEQAISEERNGRDSARIAEMFEATILPKRRALLESFDNLVREKKDLLKHALGSSRRESVRATSMVGLLGAAVTVLAIALFLLSTRTLARLERTESELQELNRNLESRVVERTGELRKAVKELEGFAYAIAHNLRAPLRAMAGFADLAAEESGPGLNEAGREHLTRVRKAACRMDDLIQGLLQLTRLSFTPFALSEIDGARIVAEAIGRMAPTIREKGARVDVASAIPRIIGNEALFGLAVHQLLSNALKFVAAGVPPRVTIRGEVLDRLVRLRIQDNGIGISPVYRERIFGIFEQLEQPEIFPGVGIGLAVAKKAVERMGGTIGVSSGTEGGSEFWIELPAAHQEATTTMRS